LSFAQFEREIIGERIRDKIAGSTPSGGRSARVLSGASFL
jgi:DNA invertase Pin-like site-specific DNA recombinase